MRHLVLSQLFKLRACNLSYLSFKRNTSSYFHRVSNNALVNKTYSEILSDASHKNPDQVAVVSCEQNVRKTFQELLHDVQNLAAGFLSLGLERGSKVGVWSPNNYEWITLQLALATSGLVMVTLNPALTQMEVEYALKKTDCGAVVVADSLKGMNYYDTVTKIIPEISTSKDGNWKSDRLPHLKHLITIFGEKKSGTIQLQELTTKGEQNGELKTQREKIAKSIQSDDCTNIQLTSGTTGLPKAVMLSHFNLVNNALSFIRHSGFDSEKDIICVPVPLFHCFGNVFGSTAGVCGNLTVVLPSATFNSKAVLQALDKEKCTRCYGSPTMFIDMINHPEFDQYDYSSMRGGILAASTCPVELLKLTNEKLNMKDVCIAYGTTENSPLITMSDASDPFELRCSTVGRTAEHIETKIIDDKGRVVKRGEIGELCARGYQVMLGYYKDKENTEEVLGQDGWYKTGDLSTMDDDGFIRIVGRIKDMIIRGGENIYPREIEEYLHTLPAIAEVQVFGIPDKRLGEVVCAWIKLKDNQTLTEDDIREFCKDKLSHFKIPTHINFVDSFPTTTSGKVQKYKIAATMKDNLIKS